MTFGSVKSNTTQKKYTSEAFKMKRLQEIEEDLEDIQTRTALLQRQKDKYVNVQQYSQAADITQQVTELCKNKRKLEEEAEIMRKKQKVSERQKSKQKKKATITSSQQKISTMFSKKPTSCGQDSKDSKCSLLSGEVNIVIIDNTDTSSDRPVQRTNATCTAEASHTVPATVKDCTQRHLVDEVYNALKDTETLSADEPVQSANTTPNSTGNNTVNITESTKSTALQDSTTSVNFLV